ncbi:MAG: NAD(P)H-hydrate dehydratase [Chloroflexi bacterium]|nr:NAD(P)H-hydrate dehydratase [Chloroflexota bacterium]
MKVVSVAEMREIEKAANDSGYTYAAMMERAGQAVVEAILEQVDIDNREVLVLVGPGNNGGDGLVAARALHEAGADVTCYIWQRSMDDTLVQQVQQHGILLIHQSEDEDFRKLDTVLARVELIVDALLGTGVSREIASPLSVILGRVGTAVKNTRTVSRPIAVVAVDIPSGVNSDTGAVDPATLSTALTVTFAFPKRGQFLFPAAEVMGDMVVADIGIDPALAAGVHLEVSTPEEVRTLLPARSKGAHKGTFGKVMVVAGSLNYTGAPYLAAAAAARVGAGLVTCAVAQPVFGVLASRLTEATYLLLPHAMGILTPEAARLVHEKLDDYKVLLLGPGLSQEKEAVGFVQRLLGLEAAATSTKRSHIGFSQEQPAVQSATRTTLPLLVIDADGLNALAQTENWWSRLQAQAVLTPHPAEMARLLGTTTEAIQQDRIGIAHQAAAKFGQIVVLKGAYSIIATPEGRTIINPMATPALATAGTGDVLAGIIAGLLAQGLEPLQAAVLGTYLHGMAGEIAEDEIGEAGVLASDLLPLIPRAIRDLRGEE